MGKEKGYRLVAFFVFEIMVTTKQKKELLLRVALQHL